MFLASFAAGPWQANTYLVGADERQVVVIDPGVDALAPLHRLVEEHSLTVVGILLTHGHIDHVASATLAADQYGVPVWIHQDDRQLLTDPAAGISPESAAMLDQMLGYSLVEPTDLRFFADGDQVEVGGLGFSVTHAPGHTPGCVVLETPYPEPGQITGLLFSGDVLFAGSIGRTDLPGGDSEVMKESLRQKILPLSRSLAVLPGHGPQTTTAREFDTNPFLQPAFLEA